MKSNEIRKIAKKIISSRPVANPGSNDQTMRITTNGKIEISMPQIAVNESVPTKFTTKMLSDIYDEDPKKAKSIEDKIEEHSHKVYKAAYDLDQLAMYEAKELAKELDYAAAAFTKGGAKAIGLFFK